MVNCGACGITVGFRNIELLEIWRLGCQWLHRWRLCSSRFSCGGDSAGEGCVAGSCGGVVQVVV